MLLPLRRPGPSATYFTICFTTRLTTGRWHSDAVGYVLYRMCWPTLLHALLLEDDTVTPSCSLFFLFNYVALFFLPALLHALLLEDDTVTPSCSLFFFSIMLFFSFYLLYYMLYYWRMTQWLSLAPMPPQEHAHPQSPSNCLRAHSGSQNLHRCSRVV